MVFQHESSPNPPETAPSAAGRQGNSLRQIAIAIVGPTGIGKSEVALALAQKIPADIIVVDSMQVYRGMEVGTGKPSKKIRTGIPHHGLDLVEPEESFDVARYVKEVTPSIKAVWQARRLPLLVGGSGLYLRALLDGLSQAPGRDPVLRKRFLIEGRKGGAIALHKKLREVDPDSADRIHPHDLRRTVRALEVYHATGRTLSAWNRETTQGICFNLEGSLLVGLTQDRELLYRRIEERIDRWLADGWLEEARGLHSRPLSQTAREALGYKELFAYLEGRCGQEETISLIKRNTRRYAKRQWGWFRADPRIEWIRMENIAPEVVADQILDRFRALRGAIPFLEEQRKGS